MKLVRTEDAIGHVLCHDMTQILPGDGKGSPRFKGPRFKKGPWAGLRCRRRAPRGQDRHQGSA